MPQAPHLEGSTFGRLTVSRKVTPLRGKGRWLCMCECGQEIVVTTGNLRSGNSRSCGCLVIERIGNLRRSHGRSKSAEYRNWMSMKARCYNNKVASYQDYGARGIRVCDRWLDSFEAFLEDMGMRPTPDHTVDRIDVDGDYEPKNCRWLAKPEQARNSRSNRKITIGGVTMTASEWARRVGLKPSTVLARLRKGRGADEALAKGRLR